jgi:hypothetical protein
MKKLSTHRLPVSQSLNDLYELNMHLPYQAACSGKFTVVAFGHLAAALSVVRYALEFFHIKSADAIPALDSALETLHAVRMRGDKSDVWEITTDELPVIQRGIQTAEHCIAIFSTAPLQHASDMLLMHINDTAKA